MEIVYTDNITIFMMRSSPVNERRTFVPEKGAVERPANSLGISVHSSVKGQQTSFTVSRKQVSLLIIWYRRCKSLRGGNKAPLEKKFAAQRITSRINCKFSSFDYLIIQFVPRLWQAEKRMIYGQIESRPASTKGVICSWICMLNIGRREHVRGGQPRRWSRITLPNRQMVYI